MLRAVILLGLAVTLLAPAVPAVASPPQSVTIETAKPFGFVPGTFSASGAFSDSGSISNLSRTISAIGAPTFLISHVTILFKGDAGTFTIRTNIVETLTENPDILTNEGTWVILDGTGAYANLRGGGRVAGTADHTSNLITRTYTGDVHFD